MRNKYILIAVVLIILAFGVGRLSAGTPDSPGAPTTTNSYTLEDIYNRLNAGTAGAQSTFTEPAAGPGPTMHTLNDIMGKAPTKDDTNGATTADVMAGKKFWGLTGGQWGLQTGNLATQTVDNTTVNQAAGYYNAFDLSAVDTDLASGNIRNGVSIYGVAGDPNVVNTSSGDAVASDILSGKKAWVDGAEVTGNIAAGNNVDGPDGAKTFNIPDGFYSGKTATANDADLVAGNIKQGVDIFGVNGTVIQATGNATAGDVLTGKTFSNATAAGISGTMPNNGAVTITPGTSDQAIAAGYHNGSGKVQGDADLVAGNIKQGVNLFGVDGTLTCGGGAGVPKTGAGPISGYTLVPGEDGLLQKGVAWPNPRFTDNNNGTVTDNLTGLIWLKNANCFGGRNWATALSDANGLAAPNCELSDGSTAGMWRLPNVREMQSLVDYGWSDLALPSGHPFTAVQSSYYWSSTTYAGSTSNAWIVYLSYNYVGLVVKTASFYVWPVRGGQGVNLFGVDGTLTSGGGGAGVPKTGQTTSYATGDDGDLQKGVAWPNPRFTDNSNGTATDNLTGLIWLKNANCANATRIWATALSDVASLNSAGTMNSNNCGDTSKSGSHQTDWRLPNVREMQSLVDYGRSDLALPSGHPFTAIQSYYYWSSTTRAYGTSNAWSVGLNGGYVFDVGKTGSFYVWPVRGGQ